MRLILLVPALCAAADISQVSWLAGVWKGQMGRAAVEEHWLAPAGGAMLGMSRTVAGTRMLEFEYLRLIERNGDVLYVAQPGGRPPTEFKLTSASDKKAVFENPAHDFPKTITYERDGAKMTATISGGEKKIAFHFTKAD